MSAYSILRPSCRNDDRRSSIFGLSNYASWEVAEIVSICRARGYVQPTIYQAMYNAITRGIEPELVPCCRKFGLRLVIYNPLAGGFFAGKIPSADEGAAPKGGRFDPSNIVGQYYRARYLREGYFRALESLKTVADAHGLRLTEIALRWCQHHSALLPSDGIILGASSAEQMQQNCEDSEKGPLPEEVVQVRTRLIESRWSVVLMARPGFGRCMEYCRPACRNLLAMRCGRVLGGFESIYLVALGSRCCMFMYLYTFAVHVILFCLYH